VLTKAIIQSIDYTKNICRVRIPLFENAARNTNVIEADAQFSVVPGLYNSYKVGDVVFIGFEENKMEAPVILGKLFVSTSAEASDQRGTLSGNSLSITDTAQLPYSTLFDFTKISQNNPLYNDLNTPKKLADSILNLQRPQVQKYQTIIKVFIDGTTYDLYLKTSNDFTYSPDTSDEPLYRLCTALKNSQPDNTFIPLDLAVKNGTAVPDTPTVLQIQEINSTDIKLKVFINGSIPEITKANIIGVQSFAIYY
jgi:hypothetical protein